MDLHLANQQSTIKYMCEKKLPKDELLVHDIKNTFVYECLSFIQDKKERGHDAKDILEDLEDFLKLIISEKQCMEI